MDRAFHPKNQTLCFSQVTQRFSQRCPSHTDRPLPRPPSALLFCVVLTVALRGGSGCQGNRVLHGGSEAWVAAVGVAESGSIDVERGVLGREGRRRQGVGRVSEGRWLPHATAAAGRLVQRELLVLQRETGSEKHAVDTIDVLEM